MSIYEERLNRAARRCSEIMDILVDTLERAPEIHRPRVIDVAANAAHITPQSEVPGPIIMPYTTNTLDIPRDPRS